MIYGLGDFDDTQSAISSLFLRDVGRELSALPPNARSVIIDVSQAAQNTDWQGTADVRTSGAVNVLVWPRSETCRLSRNVEPRVDVTLGVFGRHLMVAGGRVDGQVPHTFVGDLSTGVIEKLEFGLEGRRARATVTAFRASVEQDPSPAIIAGGDDPDTQAALATAEIYVPARGDENALGDVERARIDLAEPRTKHGAVVLVTGETLLVGGTGQAGTPLRTMEILDPKTRRNRTTGVALLAVPRANPTVLRLASGEILVAGGVDASGENVATLEWFAPDASRATKRPVALVGGRERGFVPLSAGGALAVVAPVNALSDFKTVWVISADGTLEAGVPVTPRELGVVRLFPGSDGAPVLWTGTRWLRWQPWSGAFEPIANAPLRGPLTSAIASGDSGLALWLDGRSEDDAVTLDGQLYVRGYRFATRSRYGRVKNPLLVEGPFGLAPDRLAGAPGSSLTFIDGRGLELGPGASAFVTDVTYADVIIELDGVPSPLIVLRQENGRELEVGGDGCAFAQTATRQVKVTRRGAKVETVFDDGAPRTCVSELDSDARISIGVRGVGGVSVAHNLRIGRL